MHNYSSVFARNQGYTALIERCSRVTLTVKEIAVFGSRLMQREKLHPHFFSFLFFKTALYLTFFLLFFPY